MNNDEARQALDAVTQGRDALAARARWPLWRHALAGALQSAFLMIWAVPMPMAAVLMALCVACIGLIVASDRRTHGFFVNGWSSRQARPAALLATFMAFAGFAAVIETGNGINQWSPIAPWIALAVGIGVTGASLWWERLYRAELQDRSWNA
ncbi:hypothetical protein [Sphingomicrobium flavum]|uniref:hypothetical protein n=1 Tax=Sphingomicrobium flavum TaxID=1229164 RepID=UPI0021AD851B|nr:hypothetical protein [Sphingomicrobium flavum]